MSSLINGRYVPLQRLGEGTQGWSWKVEDLEHPTRATALKLSRPGPDLKEDDLMREFSFLARLSTPGLAPVYDLGILSRVEAEALGITSLKGPSLYITRRFLSGVTLGEWEETSLQLRLQVAIQLASALLSLHAAGVAHGDVKPENVILSTQGDSPRAWLIDLGLGHEIGETPDHPSVSGTPLYLAPELWRLSLGEVVQRACWRAVDVYAFSLMCAELLSGEKLIQGDSMEELARAHLEGLSLPERFDWPARLRGSLARGLSTSPEARPPVDELLVSLLEAQTNPEESSGFRQRVIGALRPPFLGRKEELDRLVRWHQGRERGRAHAIGVVGPAGIGKSKLLEALRWRLQLREASKPRQEVIVEARATGVEENPWAPLLSLARRITGEPAPAWPLGTHHFGVEQMDDLTAWFEGRLKGRSTTLLWDDLDLASPMVKAWLKRALPRLSKSLILIATGRELGEFQPHLNDSLRLQGVPWEEARGWLTQRAQLLGYPNEIIDKISGLSRAERIHPIMLERVGNPEDLGEGSFATQAKQRFLGVSSRARMVAAGVAALEKTLALEEACASFIPSAHVLREEELLELSHLSLVRVEWGEPIHLAAPWKGAGRLFFEALSADERGLLGLRLVEALASLKIEPTTAHLQIWLGGLEAAEGDMASREALQRALEGGWKGAAQRAIEGRHFRRATHALGALLGAFASSEEAPGWEAEALELLAHAGEKGGLSEEALDALTPLLKVRSESRAARVHLARAQLLSAQGRFGEALSTLSYFSAEVRAKLTWTEPRLMILWALRKSELSLRTGKYRGAQESADIGLSLAEGGAEVGLIAQLHMVRGAALTFQGEAGALRSLDQAQQLLSNRTREPALLARLNTYRAIALSRSGALDEATEAYRQALDEAERAGLDAQLPTYLLNAGTAYHRQGRFGLAREYYARGARLASSQTRVSTRVRLLMNGANIDIQLGRYDEAQHGLASAREMLGGEGGVLSSLIGMLEADLCGARGERESACQGYERAAAQLESQGDPVRTAEALLKAANLTLDRGVKMEAQELLRRAIEALESGQAADLEAFAGVVRARIELASGGLEAMTALERYRKSLLEASERGDHLLILRQVGELHDHLAKEGMGQLCQEVKALGEEAWRHVAVGVRLGLRRELLATLPSLPFETGEAPKRSPESPRLEIVDSPAHASVVSLGPNADQLERLRGDLGRYQRLLEVNTTLLNETRLDVLLPRAMDTALSLAGAERGYVLLRDRDMPFRVMISRDSHGGTIPEDQLSFSLTIARQVAKRGETLRTGAAQRDQRFSAAASVHALSLTSVLCVPILAQGEVLGTLYLDHSSRRDAFDEERGRLMEAFADQVGLALVSARRLRELEEERTAAQEARAQVEALLSEKESRLGVLRSRYEVLSQQVGEQRQIERLQSAYKNLVAGDPAMHEVLRRIDRIADKRIPVVILGESGTGKEVVARAIHYNGPRAEAPFVAINCGAVSEGLLESELFGHVRGAFTDGKNAKPGLFRAADNGTLFLDELGEMPLSMQVKLLRVLQEGEVRPVGATKSYPVDVRILAATNRDLAAMVQEGAFRQDLFYRLAGIQIAIPPLRERRRDIPALVERFVRREGEEGVRFSSASLGLLMSQSWPGNVRQLENVVRTACALRLSPLIDPDILAPLVEQTHRDSSPVAPLPLASSSRVAVVPGRRRVPRREELIQTLEEHQGHRQLAAQALGISERTLYRYLKRYDLKG